MGAEPQRPWAEADMEAVAHVSAAHLRRLFRDHLKVTPRRGSGASASCSRRTSWPGQGARVSAVAEACGFCDIYHFSREFRRTVGQSPTQWRRNEAGF
jgi:AraC-like DNA-binding protein